MSITAERPNFWMSAEKSQAVISEPILTAVRSQLQPFFVQLCLFVEQAELHHHYLL